MFFDDYTTGFSTFFKNLKMYLHLAVKIFIYFIGTQIMMEVPALLPMHIVSAILEAFCSTFLHIGYVSSSISYPQPLAAEEELRYVKMYKEGSEEAKNILIERNLRLVAHIVKRYSTLGYESEDLISVGTIGLIKAITTFNPDKGTRLVTYAAKCIENEIRMYIRSTAKYKDDISLHDPVSTDRDGNESLLMDILVSQSPAIDEQVELNLQKNWLYTKMKTVLKRNEKDILELRYGLPDKAERTQIEIAKMFGISRSYVSRIEKKAIKKLRNALKPESCL